ncbi:hypothetical protein [Burkholderia pseudomallei]|uniref:hypothetical protein n=1 Tax=Burkholderia pseudomallei TaxID=28450 RepID=UPI000B2AB84C|nr:hypothetical protein [Burkholderia pseudomallei]CAJ3409452.1 Uncharacterised protein [Burkholderia pseudomallei]CAJ6027885.1 Uncharacterised protein [Burkholderia pseudomallei]CAK0156348.1 Uncharacterised protein [Burkholderia pseudomallei]
MKNTPQGKNLRTANYSTKKMLTVEDFKSWQRVTEAARAEMEADIRSQAVDSLVRYVTREMSKGRSLQQAGDAFLSISRELCFPHSHIDAARSALIEMGWKHE